MSGRCAWHMLRVRGVRRSQGGRPEETRDCHDFVYFKHTFYTTLYTIHILSRCSERAVAERYIHAPRAASLVEGPLPQRRASLQDASYTCARPRQLPAL